MEDSCYLSLTFIPEDDIFLKDTARGPTPGDIEEIDMEEWQEMKLQTNEPPEDWSGPIDVQNKDDLGYLSETLFFFYLWKICIEKIYELVGIWDNLIINELSLLFRNSCNEIKTVNDLFYKEADIEYLQSEMLY